MIFLVLQYTESIPFRIPMGIVENIMDERYAGDGTAIHVITC
jgi:hypothetical protein